MLASAHTTPAWRFGVFEADAHTGELRRAGVVVKLREQCFRILVLLLEHEGQLVTREDLRKALWPSDTFVDFDHSLNAAVMKLREALGDTADKPLYIETIPKRGYRFIAPVASARELQDAIDESASGHDGVRAHEATAAAHSTHHALIALQTWMGAQARLSVTASVFVLIALTAGILYWRHPVSEPRITDYVQITNDGLNKDVIGTDGSRLYLNLTQVPGMAWLSVKGGPVAQIAIDVPPADYQQRLADVSPDGTQLLVLNEWSEPERSSDVWVVGSEGHSARLIGKAADAAWSSDGKSIVLLTREGDIVVSSPVGEEPRRIFKSAGQFGIHPSHVRWSPDGRTIRFTSGYSTIDTIWEVSADGSGLHKLLPEWDVSMPYCCGRWTPDGAFYLFLAGKSLSETYWYMSRTAQIWVLDERRRRIRPLDLKAMQLTPGPIRWGEPVPSRDGATIFARGATIRGELVRFERSMKMFRPFLGGISAEAIEFSPDGKLVAYISFPERILWRANRDGTGKIQLTERPLTPVLPQWSPDGSKILFTDVPNSGAATFYTVPANGGTPVRVITDKTGSYEDATWSPDGKKIAFCSNPWRLGHTREKVEIRLLDLSTNAVTTLPSDRSMFSPRWSPDGRLVLARPINRQYLQVFNFDTHTWKTLTTGGGEEWPVWSRDSHFVYFSRLGAGGPEGIYRTSVSDGRTERVAELTGVRETGMFGNWFGLDRDDSPLVLRDVGSNELYALTLERH